MNFYEIVSETVEIQYGYYDPPEYTCFYDIVFAETRSKAKYKFFCKHKSELGVRKFEDFPKVSIKKMNLLDETERGTIEEYVFRGDVL